MIQSCVIRCAVAAILAVGIGCSDSGQLQSPTSATSLSATTLSEGGRFTTANSMDRFTVNSCDVSTFRVHGGQGPYNYEKVTAEMDRGEGLTHWDVQYQRRNNPPGGPDDYVGAKLLVASDQRSWIEVLINENGVYRFRMKGRMCDHWSNWEEYTVTSGYEPEPTPVITNEE